MKTAAIYARYSTDRQNDSSIADQVRVCTDRAAQHGWAVIERYSDAGISGAAMGNRPGFLRMREAAMAGKFQVLLVTDTTRLARSQELAPLIERLRYQGVQVVGAQDAFDSAAGTADMQAGLSGIMSVEFRRTIRARTHTALESRAKQGRPTGGSAYGYRCEAIVEAGEVIGHRVLIDEAEAPIVREIFDKFADGVSRRTIAAELNARRVPSPGASWARTERRALGWMGSGIRVILRNERYHGVIHWNTSEWRKDPDSGKRRRVKRPRDEWITHVDESQRIISEDLWQRARDRIARSTEDGNWARAKGRPKYLLSGLLRCASCGAHYVIANRHEYACSSYTDGKACGNGVRVRRLALEEAILGPVRRDQLSPENVAMMASEMQTYYADRVRAMKERAAEAPKEIRDLTARILRLRERLRTGDPDMAPDEIEAAIERAEEKRLELEAQEPEAQQSAKVLTLLPKAAQMYRQQVELGLEGDERAALKARVFLREFLGRIDLEHRENGELWANYGLQPTALLLQVVDGKGLGFSGSGGPLR